jgi:sarcosine oxidase subunit alpha
VRAKQVVLATGAIERPVVFPNNDRPGIMLAGAARTYLNRYGVRVGRRAAIVTSADSAYEGAFDLAQQGVEIVAIIDSRQDVSSALRERAQALGVEVLANHTVLSAMGRRRVSGLAVAPVFNCEGEAQAKKSSERLIDCDVVLMSGGWTPSLHLYSQAGGAIVWREDLGGFTPDSSRPMAHVRCEGACNGDFNFGKASLFINDEAGGSGEAFVDFQNDVTADDIRLAVREGFHSIEHIKRYTTNGMATDQGKLANTNALAIAAEAAGRPIPEIGLTTFRPPYTPITFGVLAGHRRDGLYDSQRKTPLDDWAVEHGAVFEPVGQWRRARYFPLPGEDIRAAVARECRITRKSLGLFDASTLGKIEVVGPDAAEFLNRIYTNNVASLAPGRCRYGLMLGENGFILDDGIVARLSEDRFHITTTTGGAAHVLTMMEDYLQTEWPELQCWLTSVTEHWAVIAVNGPNSRKLLAPLVDGVDLDGKVFPHMSVCDATVCGVPARLFRVSFTGELGFEINVPSGHAMAVWKQLLEAGNAFDGGVYGTETMHVLRAEKGYIIVGQETDGTVTPDDVGMNWIVSKNKSDFVGKRSLTRPDIDAPNRKQLVGLKTDAPNIVLEEGLQVTEASGALPDAKSIGYVTSAYWSETIQRSIALAMIEDGRNRIGKILNVPIGAQKHTVTIVAPAFYDPTGERLDA